MHHSMFNPSIRIWQSRPLLLRPIFCPDPLQLQASSLLHHLTSCCTSRMILSLAMPEFRGELVQTQQDAAQAKAAKMARMANVIQPAGGAVQVAPSGRGPRPSAALQSASAAPGAAHVPCMVEE